MKRTPIIAGNWKMNLNTEQAVALTKALAPVADAHKDREVVLFPSFLQIPAVVAAAKNSALLIGVQNSYFEKEGAFTGEITASQIKDAQCSIVLIGHSERRTLMHETDTDVNKKALFNLAAGLRIMICVGESLEEREKGITKARVSDQVKKALQGISETDMARVSIAYEPIWAIGTGKTATPADAQEVHAEIRSVISNLYPAQTAAATRILYGGSVKADNAKSLLGQPDIDGALVGGASLVADTFKSIIEA